MLSTVHNSIRYQLSGIEDLELFTDPFQTNTLQETQQKHSRLQALALQTKNCMACALHTGRTQVIFGSGNITPTLCIIGEAPTKAGDAEGLPFIGQEAELLDRMIQAIGLQKEACYFINIVKCRPPDDRMPLPEEMDSCLQILKEQLTILQPKIILTLGEIAAQTLIRTDSKLESLRSRFYAFLTFPIIATYSVKTLLEQTEKKRLAWKDLQLLMTKLK